MPRFVIFVLSVAIAIVVAVPLIWVTVRLYNRRIGRVLRGLPAGAWGAPCVDPRAERAWRALTADDAGVHLLKSNGTTAWTWSWSRIATVDLGRTRIGAVFRTGVILHLRDGSDVGLLMPSRNTLRYPRLLAERAVTQLRSRQPAA